ncbi:MAG: GGDEF domain-containing protein [Campylobacterota bacterium]|nr:GGDEF domain-containing protein [Campylobacterota bacterium]
MIRVGMVLGLSVCNLLASSIDFELLLSGNGLLLVLLVVAGLLINVLVYRMAWNSFSKRVNKKLKVKVDFETSRLTQYNDDLREIIEKKTLELDTIEEEIIEKSKEYSSEHIYNRKAFYKISNVLMNIAKREHIPLTLMLVNIDNFQEINSHYGRKVSNDLVNVFISLIEFYSRHSDTIGRFGGGEFMLLLPYTTEEGAEVLAKKLRDLSDKQSQKTDDASKQFTISTIVETVDLKSDTIIHEVLERVENTFYLKTKNR